MSNQAERIRAALLRFKAAQPGEGNGETGPAKSDRQLVIIDERNLAALSPSGVNVHAAESLGPAKQTRARALGKQA